MLQYEAVLAVVKPDFPNVTVDDAKDISKMVDAAYREGKNPSMLHNAAIYYGAEEFCPCGICYLPKEG